MIHSSYKERSETRVCVARTVFPNCGTLPLGCRLHAQRAYAEFHSPEGKFNYGYSHQFEFKVFAMQR
jgi:hypothetical protein